MFCLPHRSRTIFSWPHGSIPDAPDDHSSNTVIKHYWAHYHLSGSVIIQHCTGSKLLILECMRTLLKCEIFGKELISRYSSEASKLAFFLDTAMIVKSLMPEFKPNSSIKATTSSKIVLPQPRVKSLFQTHEKSIQANFRTCNAAWHSITDMELI